MNRGESRLVIWGAGGHGAVVAEVAVATGGFAEIAFIDDGVSVGTRVLDFSVIGPRNLIPELRDLAYDSFFIAIGDNGIRRDSFGVMCEAGLLPAELIHPSACVSPSATIGRGTLVMPYVVVNARSRVGVNCILNTGCIVEHDCEVGDHVHLASSSALGGGARVGSEAMVGMGAMVLPGQSVGSRATLGAGAVAVKPISDGCVAVGVPARLQTVKVLG